MEGENVRVVVSAPRQGGGQERRQKEAKAAVYVPPKARDRGEGILKIPTPQRLFSDRDPDVMGVRSLPGQADAGIADLESGMERLSVVGPKPEGKGRDKGKNRLHSKQKPKNTESFEPDGSMDMRVLVGRGHKRSLREDKGIKHNVQDVVMVPELFCEQEDVSMYTLLLQELRAACPEGGPEAGLTLQKGREGLWVMWHGDTHCIADDKKMGGKWKAMSPTFTRVVDRMSEYFDMDVKATRFNWYRGTDDWKPYHHDRAAFTPNCQQNITVAASFGITRDIGFQHAKSRTVVNVPQPNGCCYAFGRDVNIDWKHGVLPMRQADAERGAASEFAGGRMSIIAWGWVDMEEIQQ